MEESMEKAKVDRSRLSGCIAAAIASAFHDGPAAMAAAFRALRAIEDAGYAIVSKASQDRLSQQLEDISPRITAMGSRLHNPIPGFNVLYMRTRQLSDTDMAVLRAVLGDDFAFFNHAPRQGQSAD